MNRTGYSQGKRSRWGLGIFYTPTHPLFVATIVAFALFGFAACSDDETDPVAPCLQEDSNPIITHWGTPVNPPEAIAQRIEGTVIVQVLVGVDGTVVSAGVIQSVHIILNDAALVAASECAFIAGIRNCTKVELKMALPFNFRIE